MCVCVRVCACGSCWDLTCFVYFAAKVAELEQKLEEQSAQLKKLMENIDGKKKRESVDDEASPAKKKKKRIDGSEQRLVSSYAVAVLTSLLGYIARNRTAQGATRGIACEQAWEQVAGKGAGIPDDFLVSFREIVSKKQTNHFVRHRQCVAHFTQKIFVEPLGLSKFDLMLRRMWGLNTTDDIVDNIWHDRGEFLKVGSPKHEAMWAHPWMCDIFRKGNYRKWWSRFDIAEHYTGEYAVPASQLNDLFFPLNDPAGTIPTHRWPLKAARGQKREKIRFYGTLYRKSYRKLFSKSYRRLRFVCN